MIRLKKTGILIIISCFNCILLFGQNKSLRLWYKQPATRWEETLPLGTGRLGMMPDGGVTNENITLNDITLWSGSSQDANNYDAYKYLPEIRKLLVQGKNNEAQNLIDQHFVCTGKGSGGRQWGCYQILGNLQIKYDYGEATTLYQHYERQLSLDSALASTSFSVNGVNYKREYFTSFGSDVDVIRLTANKKGMINCCITISRPERATVSLKDNVLEMSGQLDNGTDGKGMKYDTKVKVVLNGGKLSQDGNNLVIGKATAATIIISAGTDFKNTAFEAKLEKDLESGLNIPFAEQKKEHVTNFQKLFDRVSLNLGASSRADLPTDKRLDNFKAHPETDNGLAALFFQYGRYLTISSTRVGLLPPNLQGLWANQIHTPWNGDYHLDVNVEMNHWPVEVSNLSELNLPLAELVKNMVPHGERTAKAYYNAKGWVAHVITNVWGFTEPGESASWGISKAGSGWLCDNLWQHYEFTNDTAYLDSIYPILKGSAAFYNSILVKDPVTGWLVTSPSSSPENTFYLPNGKTASICMGATIDNQIIRELFGNVIKASKLLSKDISFRKVLQDKLTKIPPAARIAPDGRIMEWLRDFKETDVHHRHISHLYGLYPASLISPDKTPAWATAAKKTLNARGDDGPSWSIAYKQIFWARLYDGNRAYKLLKNVLRPTMATNINYGSGGGVYPNLLSAGPPFQIDANFGAEAGIGEMLLQSNEGFIDLLPAIPDQWKSSGEVKGLKARGNFTVSFKWVNGKVTAYTISSPIFKSVKVRVNGIIKTIQSEKQ